MFVVGSGTMRTIFFSIVFSFLFFLSGCIDRPEVSPDNYGVILETLPDLEAARLPFPFPVGADGKDHSDCVFPADGFF